MDASTTSNPIRFREVRALTGWAPHTVTRRLQRAGIQHYTDGMDRRQRVIDARDLPRLLAHEPVARRERSAA